MFGKEQKPSEKSNDKTQTKATETTLEQISKLRRTLPAKDKAIDLQDAASCYDEAIEEVDQKALITSLEEQKCLLINEINICKSQLLTQIAELQKHADIKINCLRFDKNKEISGLTSQLDSLQAQIDVLVNTTERPNSCTIVCK